MDKITREERLFQWRSIIDEYRNSGMTVRSWCIEKNINSRQFYYWQRRLSGQKFETVKRSKSQEEAKFVQLQVPTNSSKPISSFNPDIVIHMGNNKLELSNTASEELLSNVIKVMSDVK